MRALLALIPCAGLAIAGTWWWGGDAPASPPIGAPPQSAAQARQSTPGERREIPLGGTNYAFEQSAPELDMSMRPRRSAGHPPTPAQGEDSRVESLHGVLGVWPVRDQPDVEPQLVQRLEDGEGVLQVEWQPKAEALEGYSVTYHAPGHKASEGMLRNGKRVGPWSEWHSNGQESAAGEYYHGEKHGYWATWYDNGQLHEAGDYLYGRKEGLWTSWYAHGQKERVGYYRNDRAEDRATLWYRDGTKAAEGSFADNLREGLWLDWHENGSLSSRGSYFRGRAEGRWEYWDMEGGLEAKLSGLYKGGQRVGD